MVGGKYTTIASVMYQEVIGQLDFGKGPVHRRSGRQRLFHDGLPFRPHEVQALPLFAPVVHDLRRHPRHGAGAFLRAGV